MPKMAGVITRVVEVTGWDGGKWTRIDMIGPEMHIYVKAEEAPAALKRGKMLKLMVG
jgi:hypothetical protein